MKVKVCGLKQAENIKAISQLNTDFMGFIFYPKSKRFVDMKIIQNQFKQIDESVNKVAVFVNETAEDIHKQISSFEFDFIQLHGKESPQTVTKLKSLGYGIIKAFSINTVFNFNETKDYEEFCDYFLFDTATPLYGGSGKKFNWDILSNYKGKTPFLLSGGISAKDINDVKNFSHSKLAGVDLNSGFEIEPGLKDVDLLEKFIKEIK